MGLPPRAQTDGGIVLAGRFLLGEPVGERGGSKAYRAVDQSTGASVTVKLLSQSAAENSEQAERLFAPAWAASRLRNPGLTTVLASGWEPQGPYLVTEYCAGVTLSRLVLGRERMPLGAALALVDGLLQTLEVAHAAGLVHGDLKPELVELARRQDGRVSWRISEFGLVLGLLGKRASGARVFGFGIADYLAPEQVTGGRADSRSDLHACAVILFELLTGTHPFHLASAAATAYQIAQHQPARLDQVMPGASASLADALVKGLAKQPHQRYQRAREFREALRRRAPPQDSSRAYWRAVLPELLERPRDVAGGLARDELLLENPATSRAERATSIPPPRPGVSSGVQVSQQRSTPLTIGQPDFVGTPDRLSSVLPVRFRGRHHVRGIVWQGLDEFVRARRPLPTRERILASVGSEQARDVLNGTIQGIIYYDLEPLTRYVELVSDELFDGRSSWCHPAGRDAVEGCLSTALLRGLPAPTHPTVVMKHIAGVLSHLFDFGRWQVESLGPKAAQLTVSEFEPASAGLRSWIHGVVERAVLAIHSAECELARGETSFSPRLVLVVRTR